MTKSREKARVRDARLHVHGHQVSNWAPERLGPPAELRECAGVRDARDDLLEPLGP